MAWRQMALVIEKRIPCGECREEDSPITIWKEGFKRKGGGEGGMKECFWMSLVGASKRFSLRCEPKERTAILCLYPDSLAVTSG
jgi:hypothetical protein